MRKPQTIDEISGLGFKKGVESHSRAAELTFTCRHANLQLPVQIADFPVSSHYEMSSPATSNL